MGIGVVSLMLILGISVQTPTQGAAEFSDVTQPAQSMSTTAANAAVAERAAVHLVPHANDWHSEVSQASPALSKPSHLLSAHMTHHRLTGARFSVPVSHEHEAIASIASAK